MMSRGLLLLYTDFGAGSHYAGEMEMVCRSLAPDLPVVALTHQAPRHNPRAAATLLAALADGTPRGSILICVVDPQVGSARRALVVKSQERWFVGPDNGLMAAAAGDDASWFHLEWRPDRLSDTFH
ncbi:MAG: SAM-dependent chlorinase/fluorinase, partial [Mariprofundales bacterium]|nr:SAM-dependent chlorinase/fluorinase [Mariprofundales bacterium]